MNLKRGQEATVTNPFQPTGHKGGETGVVVATSTPVVGGTPVDLVQIQEDSTGGLSTVYAEEITRTRKD
ncbi:hypothetical protein ACFYOY_36035 [Streptomyces sp. NPDC007875]|uniref:hypothetical protein n=1 Tax=Streptomyces sp. NPDC007875 TaxID=3364783 RepID=UPI003698701A